MAKRCLYEYHRKENIHQLTLLESSEAGVNQFIGYLDRITSTEDDAPGLFIDFTQSGLPPVNHFISRINDWQEARPFAKIGRRAVIYSGTGMTLSLLQNIADLLDLFQTSQTQFFQKQHAEEARRWLRETPAPARA